MLLTLVNIPSNTAAAESRLISWNTPCQFCRKPVNRDYPLVVFSVQQAALIGVAHFACGDNAFSYAQFRLQAPGILSAAQTGFLAHFYPALFKLPGWGQSRSLLRRCLASMLLDFPECWSHPAPFLESFIQKNLNEIDRYPGDLESDFFNFLGEVKENTQLQPLYLELDFASVIVPF
jgi:hypothetical protein